MAGKTNRGKKVSKAQAKKLLGQLYDEMDAQGQSDKFLKGVGDVTGGFLGFNPVSGAIKSAGDIAGLFGAGEASGGKASDILGTVGSIVGNFGIGKGGKRGVKKTSGADKRKERGKQVAKLMKEKGMTLGQASHALKQQGKSGGHLVLA